MERSITCKGVYARYLQKYPKDIVDFAYTEYPEDIYMDYDEDGRLIDIPVDQNANARHFFILGMVAERNNTQNK